MTDEAPCCETDTPSPPRQTVKSWWLLPAALLTWYLLYRSLQPFAIWFTYSLLKLPMGDPVAGAPICPTCDLPTTPGTPLAAAVEFFIYDTPKVLLLLTLVVFGVGIIRSFFTPERTRRLLAGTRESAGNVLAALLGIVTPFCSCSAVPLFIGFVTAGVPLGVTFSFLIAAPMVNEVAVVMLFGLFGWRVAALYLGTGLLIAIIAGWIIGHLRLESHVEEWVYETRTGDVGGDEALDWPGRLRYGLDAVRDIVGKVWPFVVAGIALGAWMHGYVPENFMTGLLGNKAWWSVPLAVLLGVPMYANAAGMIPIVQVLLEKGAALGAVLAFMMAVIALSLPEVIILRRVLKPRLIAVFIGVVAVGIMLVGYLFNALDVQRYVVK